MPPARRPPTQKGNLAEQLAALISYRNRPDHPPEPITSNWATVPANENVAARETGGGFFTERHHEMTPSVQEIMRQVEPADGSPPVILRNDAGQVVAIGALAFSDGTQTEKAFTIGPDGDAILYDRRMPAGAMLKTAESQTTSRGAGRSRTISSLSNARLAVIFGVRARPYLPGKRKRRTGKSYTVAESRALLDTAMANTPALPAVTLCPPGLPNGTPQASDCFIGGRVAATGKGGGIGWVDLFTSLDAYSANVAALSGLSAGDRDVLDKAMGARSIAELGSAGHRRTRERQGWARLKVANDNFEAALKKLSG